MHTLTWLAWLASALVATGLTNNPLYLLLALLAAALVLLTCRADAPVTRAYWLFFVAGLMLWIGYVVFSVVTVGGARGRTVLLVLPSLKLPPLLGGITLGGPATIENLVWGAVRGLRVWVLLAVFGAFNALVNHHRLLRLAPRSLFHAGLVLTIAISFVPHSLRAIVEIIEAQRSRGHRFSGLRSFVALVSPLLASSLEKSIQLAEALDSRGYGRAHVANAELGRQQIGAIVGLLLLGGGLFSWFYYGPGAGLLPPAVVIAGIVVLGLTLRALGRLVPRTVYRRERWHQRDRFVLAAALIGVSGWVGLWMTGARLIYNPYPVISAPPFDPLPGLLSALLAAPAVFSARTAEPPRARRRATRRSVTRASALVAEERSQPEAQHRSA